MNSFLPHIGLLSEYQKEYLDYSGPSFRRIEGHHLTAKDYSKVPHPCSEHSNLTKEQLRSFDVESTSKESQRTTSEDSDSIEEQLPAFRGESTYKKTYCPQPALSRLTSSKPTKVQRPPMHLNKGMAETESVSMSTYKAFPVDITRIASWPLQKPKDVKVSEERDGKAGFPVATSYLMDYCGSKVVPRRVCLAPSASADVPARGRQGSLHDNLHDYVQTLLFRTSTGDTYRPPVKLDGSCCYNIRSELQDQCPAQHLATQLCKVHRNQVYYGTE